MAYTVLVFMCFSFFVHVLPCEFFGGDPCTLLAINQGRPSNILCPCSSKKKTEIAIGDMKERSLNDQSMAGKLNCCPHVTP